jgi:DNA-binding LacI/PurR family transcriptional regulator
MKNLKGYQSTIYDVAELAGTSISTVSRVINSPDRVSPEARTKVLAAIDELGFIPKAEARARALHNNRRIGVLTPFFTAPSFVQRLRGVDAALVDTPYELIIYTIDSLSRLQGYLLMLPLTGNLDGLIIMSLPLEDEVAHRMSERGLQTVTIESKQSVFSCVEIDDFQGGRMAAQYLISKGHQRCAFIGDIDPPDYAIKPVIKRLEGYRRGLEEAGLALPEEYIRSSRFDQRSTRKATTDLLYSSEPPSAIFAAADIQAAAVLKVAREQGYNVPQDLAIIGFDDLDLAEYIGLTTINQPLDESGKIAAEMLLARLENPQRPVQTVHLNLQVIERETA